MKVKTKELIKVYELKLENPFDFMKNQREGYSFYFLLIFFSLLIFDILIYSFPDLLVFFLILFWIFNIKKLKIKPFSTLSLGTLAFLFSFIAQFLGKDIIVERGASWFFIFLSLAFGQRLIEEFFKKR